MPLQQSVIDPTAGMDILQVSEMKVLHSNAGYYVGTTYWDEDIQSDLPHSRNSGYFLTSDLANQFLEYIMQWLKHYVFVH